MIYPSQFHKPHRLKTYDYSSHASYLLTFNVRDRKPLLSTVIDRGMYEPAAVSLKRIGRITEKYLQRIPVVYPHVLLENYVIMPDHVHLLLTILPEEDGKYRKRAGVDTIIRSTKTLITKEVGYSFWQPDFYDVIADSEELFLLCDKYIDENPAAWIEKHSDPFTVK